MQARKTIGRALTEALATENRRVVSDWRALVLLRRQTASIPAEERRWFEAPLTLEDIHAILNRLVKIGEFERVKGLSYIFEALAPYARQGGLEEEEILMEVNPYAALSHATALAFHGLSEEFSQEIHLVLPQDEAVSALAAGILEGEWESRGSLPTRKPSHLFDKEVHWHRLRTAPSDLGTAEYRPRGYPVRVTTPERTLLDGLQRPEWCGGFQRVLEAWVRSKDTLDVEWTVRMVEDIDVGLLKQRAGFVMESLGIEHPRFDVWASHAKRGGSSKLVGTEPFESTFSERWKLSLNAPVDVLKVDETP